MIQKSFRSKQYYLFTVCILLLLKGVTAYGETHKTKLLVIGGSTSGVAAGLQASRLGIETIIIEPSSWLGGMLTTAGVSAVDGNHQLASGIWKELRDRLYSYYGGPENVATGWVSNTLFEPSVGNMILKSLVQNEKKLTVHYERSFLTIEKNNLGWLVKAKNVNHKTEVYQCDFVIDATELGDVMAALQLEYAIGMDSRASTLEEHAPLEANNIIQDFTYTAILEDYGKPVKIKKPKSFVKEDFECACDQEDGDEKPSDNCREMLEYARLPNNKYLINWPNCGNDFYANIVTANKKERQAIILEAKQHTVNFIYYIQHELGFNTLGIAKNEFPSKDGLPLIPYYRESRRLKGKAYLTARHLENPYHQPEKYYRTGIAVGNYPIDHHHKKNPEAPKIDFINIKIPAYNVPIGVLIPDEQVSDFLVAEKSISVSNIVNGTTRLQPVVLGIGQGAGTIAAVCLQQNLQPWQVSIREVQNKLLKSGACIMPYIDVPLQDPDFEVIQKIGATGIIKGIGIPYKWANEAWFYPEHRISEYEMIKGLQDFYKGVVNTQGSGKPLSLQFLIHAIKEIDPEMTDEILMNNLKPILGGDKLDKEMILSRRTSALIINHILHPFEIPVNFKGIPDFQIKNN